MKGFLKSLFSDEAGVSFGRMASLVWSGAVIAWVSIIVWRTNAIADCKGLEYIPVWFYAGGKGIGALKEIAAMVKGKFGQEAAKPPA